MWQGNMESKRFRSVFTYLADKYLFLFSGFLYVLFVLSDYTVGAIDRKFFGADKLEYEFEDLREDVRLV